MSTTGQGTNCAHRDRRGRGLSRTGQAAAAAARRGHRVLPLWPNTKVPAHHGRDDCPGTGPCQGEHAGWEQRATVDPRHLRAWWLSRPDLKLLTGLTGDTPLRVPCARLSIGMTSGSLNSGGLVGLGEAGHDHHWPSALPQWGRVVAADGVLPWLVVDDHDVPVEPVRRFLVDFVARGNRSGSVRSYAFGLLRWWRWLLVVDVRWDQATSEEVRGLVLWLLQAAKARRAGRTVSASTAGTVNAVTRKQYLDDGYQPRTIRHSNAVIRSFYVFWLDLGEAEGPLVNPVPLQRKRGVRPNGHHNPLQPWRAEGRLRYNPRLPKPRPRAMTDEQWFSLFGALRSNRDRAILAIAVSSAARAAELLAVRAADLDWGEQLIRVRRKGTDAQQWLPASAEAFVWIRCYLADLGQEMAPGDPLWQTLRRRDRGAGLARQPLNYEALRAVFRRVNVVLGTNWSMHDLRHTAALRMNRDESLSLRDVQVILGHAHLSTTADVYLVEDEAEVVRRVHQHFVRRQKRGQEPAPAAAAGYDGHDLAVLFGKAVQ